MDQDAPSVVVPFPHRLTSFVGRVTELQAVLEELSRHRLVSLVGPGGCGKTRLALEAGRAWTGGSRWFVDLATVGDDDEVDAALAVATGALEGPGEGPLEATARRIGDGQALILLDNCDQVVAACARVAHRLLQSCPGLTVLATSREPLRTEGESVWRVPPLSLPADEEVLDGDAVLLFLDRASLAVDDAVADRATIHEICRRLDGMPLAIELAASRATVLPVADILDGLADRFRLLTGGLRTADPRQQSLAASIEWGYRVLDDDERRVLARLAVFRSPFTAEGARAVAAGEGIDERDVLGVVGNLVDKSFVVIDERHEVARYRLLETIRQYAADQLDAQPDDAHATRDRHLRYLRQTAEQAERAVDGPSPLRWLDRLEAELADIRAAVGWAVQTGRADDARRLVGSSWWFWWSRARSDSRTVIEAALTIPGGEPRWRAKALAAAALAAMAMLDPDGVRLNREAVRVADGAGDPAVAALALYFLGTTSIVVDPSAARPQLLRACALAKAADDSSCLAYALGALALAELADLPAATARAEEAVALALANGHDVAAGHSRLALAIIAAIQGRLEEGTAVAAAGLENFELTHDRPCVTALRLACSWLAVLRGDDGAAADHASAAEALATASGNPLLDGMAALAAGLRGYANGDLAAARPLLAEGIPVASRFAGAAAAAPVGAAILADADLCAGDRAEAGEHAAHAAALAESADIDWGRSRAALAHSRVDLHDGELQAAAEAAHRALTLAQRTDDALTTVDALELLARIAWRRQSPPGATRLLAAAAAERARIGYARFAVHAPEHEALVAELERQLGADDLAQLWSEGERLRIVDAVALARSRRGRRGRPAAGWDALTPAERRVVALVGEGLNNVEIAERLFVTRETVKSHLSRAFTKLAVSNRTELAAEATRRAQDPANRATAE